MNSLLPAPPERDLPPALRARLRAELVNAAASSTDGSASRVHGSDRRRSSRRVILRPVSLIAAVLVAVVLFVVSVVLPSGSPAGVDPAAASLLHRFSALALNLPGERPLQDGEYVYQRTMETSLMSLTSEGLGTSFRYFVPTTDERWLGTDGSGRSDWTVGQPTFLTDADQALYEQYVSSGLMEQEWGDSLTGRNAGSDDYGPGEWTFFDFSDLPTDVNELKGMIERREIIGGPEGDWETFNLSADILTWSYAPPELRSALFEVMASLPGVTATGRTRDAFGRPGIVVGYTHEDSRQDVVFDRQTGQVLERRWVSISGDPDPLSPDDVCSGPTGSCGAGEMWIAGPPGTFSSVITYEVYGAVVDQMGDIP